MTYLLDTNVISEIRKSRRDPVFNEWFDRVEAPSLFLSALVIGELAHGVARLEQRGDVHQAGLVERWLSEIKERFLGRILPVTSPIAERWGRFDPRHPLPAIDALMAATAIEHDLTLVSRDSSVTGTGVRLLNPWA